MIFFPTGAISQQYGLGTAVPPHWAADEIIYRQLSYVDSGSGPIYFYSVKRNYLPSEVSDIDAFVLALAETSAPPMKRRGAMLRPVSVLNMTRLPGAWDIDVYHRCYIVLELDRTKSWTFQSDVECVTTSVDHSDEYFSLKHVSGVGGVLGGNPTDSDMCRILFFSVDTPQGTRNDKFSISVQFPQGPGMAPQGSTFDPDIKNNGGPPTLPLI